MARPGDDLVVLNNDVIPHRNWLERLQHAAYAGERVGIVGPMLLYPDGRIQAAGSHRNLGAPEWFDHRYRFKPSTHGPANVSVPSLGVTGACMYIRRAVIDELGPFDEGFPMAYEDVDYCLRAWEAGWERALRAERSTHTPRIDHEGNRARANASAARKHTSGRSGALVRRP